MKTLALTTAWFAFGAYVLWTMLVLWSNILVFFAGRAA